MVVENFKNKVVFLDTAPLVYHIPTPDAIQIATSIDHQAQFFLTNDNRLRSITEVKVFTISELA